MDARKDTGERSGCDLMLFFLDLRTLSLQSETALRHILTIRIRSIGLCNLFKSRVTFIIDSIHLIMVYKGSMARGASNRFPVSEYFFFLSS
jgi:hypothetical protein